MGEANSDRKARKKEGEGEQARGRSRMGGEGGLPLRG